jgi:hypothetical protein
MPIVIDRGDVRVVIYESKIRAMSTPGGMVWKWARSRARRIENLAKGIAPERTGKLTRSIEGKYVPGPPEHTFMDVTAHKRYATFVHEGTGGGVVGFRRFTTARGKHAPLKPTPGPGSHGRWRPGMANPWPRGHKAGTFIAGINADPFLEEALRSVMADIHGRSIGLRPIRGRVRR